MAILIKRVYDKPSRSDGRRILVDRLWPRGLAKTATKIHFWARAIAPSNNLRRWYGHDPGKWTTFKRRYFAELDENPNGVVELFRHIGRGTVTFVYSSKEQYLNNATALREYVESRFQSQGRRTPKQGSGDAVS